MSESIAGIRLGIAQAGLKVADQDDLVVVEFCPGTRTASLFTQNAFRAAPVVVAERLLAVAARAAGCLLVLGPTAAGRPHAVAVRPAERPAVAGPLGPCFVSRAAPRLRRRRRAAAVVREPREGLPALVLE